MAELHKAIEDGNTRDVKQLLDRKKFILAADRTGLPPFHKAVVTGYGEMVEWFIQEFKFAIEHKDNVRNKKKENRQFFFLYKNNIGQYLAVLKISIEM